MLEILKVLVGSQAHGLAGPESDSDYRAIYISPTSELLKIGAGAYKGTSWIEGETEDNTAYELGHFLHLATKSNPSILEVFQASIISEAENTLIYEDGRRETISKALRNLFPFVWSSIGVYNAFKGYSHNQRTKLFNEKEEFSKRKGKYAVAHLRVLLSGIELLRTDVFSVRVKDYYLDNKMHLHLPDFCAEYFKKQGLSQYHSESWREFLKNLKNLTPTEIPVGLIIDTSEYLKTELEKAYKDNPNHETNYDKVNEFLLRVRKEVW